MTHTHEEYDRSAVLDMGLCRCGWELKHGAWRAPKTYFGMLRAAQQGRPMDIERTRG